jgi:phosphoserine phosphatase
MVRSMRRWIRLETGTSVATLHSVVHRVPRTSQISLALAGRLAAQGVRLVVVP